MLVCIYPGLEQTVSKEGEKRSDIQVTGAVTKAMRELQLDQLFL